MHTRDSPYDDVHFHHVGFTVMLSFYGLFFFFFFGNKSLFFSTFFTKNATGDLQLKDHKSQDMDLGF